MSDELDITIQRIAECFVHDERRVQFEFELANMISSGFKPHNPRYSYLWELVLGFYYIRRRAACRENYEIGSQHLHRALLNTTTGTELDWQWMCELAAQFLVNEITLNGGWLFDSLPIDYSECGLSDRDPISVPNEMKLSIDYVLNFHKDFQQPSERANVLLKTAQSIYRTMYTCPQNRTMQNLEIIFEFAERCMQIAYQNLGHVMQFHFLRSCYCLCKEAVKYGGTGSQKDIYNSYRNSMELYARHLILFPPLNISLKETFLVDRIYTFLHRRFMVGIKEMERASGMAPHRSYWLYAGSAMSLELDPGVIMSTKMNAMVELMTSMGIGPENIAKFVKCPWPTNAEGWYCRQDTVDVVKNCSKMAIAIDRETGQIALLSEGRISLNHVATLLADHTKLKHGLLFSLDKPDDRLRFHPFHQFRSDPANIHGSKLHYALFQADYLLKQFSLGYEINSRPPFNTRPCSRDGLYKGLPEHIIRAFEATHQLRGKNLNENTYSRLWVEAGEQGYEIIPNNEMVFIEVHDIKMRVKCHRLAPDASGKNIDAPEDCDIDEETKSFTEYFTNNYDEIATFFPEFAEVKQLSMLDFLLTKLREVTIELRLPSLSDNLSLLASTAQRVVDEMRNSDGLDVEWVPAVFQSKADKSRFVFGGVVLQSDEVYCPRDDEEFDMNVWPEIRNLDVELLENLAEYDPTLALSATSVDWSSFDVRLSPHMSHGLPELVSVEDLLQYIKNKQQHTNCPIEELLRDIQHHTIPLTFFTVTGMPITYELLLPIDRPTRSWQLSPGQSGIMPTNHPETTSNPTAPKTVTKSFDTSRANSLTCSDASKSDIVTKQPHETSSLERVQPCHVKLNPQPFSAGQSDILSTQQPETMPNPTAPETVTESPDKMTAKPARSNSFNSDIDTRQQWESSTLERAAKCVLFLMCCFGTLLFLICGNVGQVLLPFVCAMWWSFALCQ